MKNKTKLMLALSILTAGTLAAGATGTFAWFTTNKTATATYNNITVQGTQGNLNVSIKGITESGLTAESAPTASVDAKNSLISDVSSNNGIDFVQPDWVGAASNDSVTEIKGVSNVSSKAGYFAQYEVTLSNISQGTNTGAVADSTSLKVSLDSIVITDGENSTHASQWVRVAINTEITKTTENDKFSHIKEGKLLVLTQKQSISADGAAKYVMSPTVTKDSYTMNDVLAPVGNSLVDLADAKKKDFVTIPSGKTETIGVSVWLEGTLQDKQDDAKGENFSVKIVFSGEAAA